MTLQTTIPLAEYVENGVTLIHPIPFQFIASSDIVCSRIAAGVETVLTLGADFSVAGGAGSTGSVTKMSAGTAGTVFRIKRRTTRAQPTDYTPGDDFPAETHEAALDRLAAANQEQDRDLADIAARTLLTAPGETMAPLPPKSQLAGKFLAGDALGNLVPANGTGNDPDLRADLAASAGSALVAFLGAVTGGQLRSAQGKLRDFPTIFDFLGCAGDGVNDDSAALERAVAHGGPIFFPRPPVRYNFQSPVAASLAGTALIGLGKPELYIDTMADPLVTVGASHFIFAGFRLTGDPSLAAAVLRIDTAAALIEQIFVEHIFGSNLYGFYEDTGGANPLLGAYLEKVRLVSHRGHGFNTSKHFGHIYLEQFSVSRVGLSGAAYNFPAVKAQNAEGIFLDECAHDGTNATSIQSGQHGFEFDNCTFVSIENTVPDHVGGNGVLATSCGTVEIDGVNVPNVNLSAIKATNCDKVRIDGGVYSSFATGDAAACGAELTNCTSVEIPSADATAMKADGFKLSSCGDVQLGLTIARANGNKGYNLLSCTDVTAAAVQAIANGAQGFATAGCTLVSTSGMILRENIGRGISSGAGDTRVLHLGAQMIGNIAGNYAINDAGNRIIHGILDGGSMVDVTAPGAA